MKKSSWGILLGTVAGIIDVIPMIFQNLAWDANISAFAFWVVAGFVISTTNLKLIGALKGGIISLILMVPIAILIGASNIANIIPVFLMTIVLGPILGHLIEKFGD